MDCTIRIAHFSVNDPYGPNRMVLRDSLSADLTGSQEVRGSIPLVSTMKDQVRAYALTFFVIKSSDWPVIKITGFSLLTTPQVTDCRKPPFSGPEMYDLALFRVLNVYVSFK